ncbi:hypothetical protein HDU98_005028 [Podochytrium sp. JEL0797]|nr:hypothetical protein HDU98_005028 [Podochytrium sp. JEL0797]
MLVRTIISSDPAALSSLTSPEWHTLALELESDRQYDSSSLSRFDAVFDFILRHGIRVRTNAFFWGYAKAFASCNHKDMTRVQMERFFDRIERVGLPSGRFRFVYLEFASKVCIYQGAFAAMECLRLGEERFNRIYPTHLANPNLPHINASLSHEILSRFSYTPVNRVPECIAARAAIHDVIQMQRQQGIKFGYGLTVLAKLCVSMEAKDPLLGESRYTADAVKEYLRWVREEGIETEMVPAAVGHLAFHALRAGEVELAKGLFEKVEFRFPLFECKRIVRELGRLDEIELGFRVYEEYMASRKPKEEKDDALSELQQEMVRMVATAGYSNAHQDMAGGKRGCEPHQFIQSFSVEERSAWSMFTLRLVCGFYVRARMPSFAVESFELMKATRKGALALKAVADGSDLRDSEHANTKEIFSLLELTYNQVLYCLAKTSPLSTLLPFYTANTSKHGFKLSKETCTVLISTYAFSHATEGTRFLEDYESHNLTADVFIYTALISSHIRGNRLDQAIELFQRMKAKGIAPNVNTFNSVVQGLCTSGKIDNAVDFLKVMNKAKCSPDTTTYNTLMNALLKRSRWTDAEKLVSKMEETGVDWDVMTFNLWISAHMRREGGDVEEAQRLIERMQQAPYFCRPSSSTYDAQLYYLAYRKEWDAMEALIQDMYPVDGRGGVLGKSHHNSGGTSTSKNMCKSFRIVVNSLCASQNVPLAVKYYRRVLESGNMRGSQMERDNLASMRVSLIKAAGKQGDVAFCHQIYGEYMAMGEVASDSLNAAMISALVASGDLSGAVAWADKVIAGAGTGSATLDAVRKSLGVGGVTSKYTGAIGFGRGSSFALMLGYARSGDGAMVEAVYAQMKRLELWGYAKLTEHIRNGSTYSINEANVLMNCYCVLGDGDKALQVWNDVWRMPSKKRRNTPFGIPRGPSSTSSQGLVEQFGVDRISVSLILDALSFSNKTAKLDAMWSMFKTTFPMDLNNYISYSESLARRGDLDGCLAFIENEMMGGSHGLAMEPKIFWSVIKLLNRDGEKQYLERLWDLMMTRYPQFENAVREVADRK